MTVKEILEACARGEMSISEAGEKLQHVRWEVQTYVEAQLVGVADIPPPPENSPDWIQLIPDLSPSARALFTRAYDRRQRRG
jgi:hypothetical protein